MDSALFSNITLGMQTVLEPTNLLFCAIGVIMGTFLGAIPGIGTLAAMSMLFPLTFYLEPFAALVMLAGIYYGTAYGGSTASILLNVPGTPANAVVCLDGYQMARQGRAGVALSMSAIGSFVGGTIGIIAMMFLSPYIVQIGLKFGPSEYFALIVLGLFAAGMISGGSPLKGIAMIVVGLICGTVGTDIFTGQLRFTFGSYSLSDGLPIVAIAMGLFGVCEIVASVRTASKTQVLGRVGLRDLWPSKDDLRRSTGPILRGAGIGAFIGTLPGIGGTLSSYMSYAVERKVADDPSRFGKGAIEGVAGPETANNASDQTAFIPTLTLGVPGSTSMALILGAMMIHGITPGPRLMVEHADLFWGLVISFWIGNLLLLLINFPLVGIWVKMLSIPYKYLFPAVLMFIAIGTYIVNFNLFDVVLVIVFGILGYGMRALGFPAAPMLLAFVLGPMIEENFRRAMTFSQGDFSIFLNSPISAGILSLTGILIVFSIWNHLRRKGQDASLL